MATTQRPDGLTATVRLLAMSDSQYPVGNFSFSNGLEAAVSEGMVHDSPTLAAYVATAVGQSINSDGIAAIAAYRAATVGDYDEIVHADAEAMLCKLNTEARRMAKRMGRKLAELCAATSPTPLISRLLADILAGGTSGSYAVVHAVAMQAAGIAEGEMIASQAYGVANMILGAALRLMRMSHYDTQRILYDLAPAIDRHYLAISSSSYDDIRTFAPGIDLAASLHEKGHMRMFMS